MLKEQKLTEKELRGYRQWLSELDEESRGEQGTSRQAMDPDLWRIFDPKGNIGRQIYESYTDEALLEAVVVTMDHPGHKPRTYQLSPIRQVYLKQRFGNINKACWAARGFRKRLEEQKRWPPDWPERVSADGAGGRTGRTHVRACQKELAPTGGRRNPAGAQEAVSKKAMHQ